MNSRLKTILSKPIIIYLAIFFLLHLALFNINVAEWGDSYRILRASEYIRNGSYPSDEKRPPLFSAIIATRPSFVDPITYGRVVVLAFSLGSFLLFIALLRKNLSNEKYVAFGITLFLLNNAYLYWSIRIMADVPFGFFVLLALYLLEYAKLNPLRLKYALIGLVVGLALLTRFEGYLLFASVFIGITAPTLFKTANFKQLIKQKNLVQTAFFLAGFAIVAIPYLLWKNPLKSSYFEEPLGRTYDLKMFASYIVSFVYLWGFIPALPLLLLQFNVVKHYLTEHAGTFLFITLEMLLILLWPAALPRLFVCIIPFLCLLVALALEKHFVEKSKNNLKLLTLSGILLVMYPIAQHFLKLQFLLVAKPFIIINFLIQIIIVIFLYTRNYRRLLPRTIVGLAFWSISIIYLHKDIYISIKNGSQYAANLNGIIAYNDVSSVANWYLNNQKHSDTYGFYYDIGRKDALTRQALEKEGIDYLLITNEQNTSMVIDLKKRPYLEEIKEFRYNINGQEFFTKVVKFVPAQER